MTVSRLRLFGAFALETPFSAGPLRLGSKPQAVLSCIALHGRAGMPRSRLIALLWADHGEEEARGAFRQCLHLLRRKLGEAAELLDIDGERLLLREAACEVDVRCFEALVARGDPESLKAAAQLYRGDLLESLDSGADFARWAATERERLRELAYKLLNRLCEGASDSTAHEEAARLAHRLLASDPVHEGCYRALMRMQAAAGLQAKALQTWNECRDALRRELGIEPSAETAALLQQLRGTAAIRAPHHADGTRTGLLAPVVPAVPPARVGDDPRVVDLNLRGWEAYATFTREGNLRARAAFQEAAALAGDHAQVIARAGWTYWTEAISGWTPDYEPAMELAWSWASRAIACNRGRYSTPHTLMGKILLWWRQRHDEALEQFRMGVALEPHYAWPHFHLGDGLMWSGECDEALASIDRALELDHNDHGMFLTIRGVALWMLGELQAAQMALDSAVTRNPSYAWAHLALTAVHFERGDLGRARQAAAMAVRFHPRFSPATAEKVLPYRRPEHRRRMLDALHACAIPRVVAPAPARQAAAR